MLGVKIHFRAPFPSPAGQNYLCDMVWLEGRKYLCTVQGMPRAKGRLAAWYVDGAGPYSTRREAAMAFARQQIRDLCLPLEARVPSHFDWPCRRETQVLTEEQANKVFDILVKWVYDGQEPPNNRQAFVFHHTDLTKRVSEEYRVCGMLGFGGKFRNHDDQCWYLDTYDQDHDPLVRYRLAQANLALFNLWIECFWDGYYEIRVLSRIFGMQNQYFSRYLRLDDEGEPQPWDNLLEFVQWREGPGNYHNVYIHKDAAPEIVLQIALWRLDQGITDKKPEWVAPW